MFAKSWAAVAALSGFAATSLAASLPTISATGSKLFDANGNQFFMKGTSFYVLGLNYRFSAAPLPFGDPTFCC